MKMSNNELSGLITMSLVITCLVAILINFFKWRLSRRHLYALAAKIAPVEGIRMLPLIGHGAYLLRSIEEIIAITRNVFAELKPPQKIWIWHELLFVVNRAEDMETILNSRKCLNKYDPVYRFNRRLTGNGLFLLPVPEWKAHRKIITPTFNQKILNGFAEVFSENAETFVELLRNKTGEIINISDYTSKYALDIVCETAMGIQIKAQINHISLEHTINRSLEIISTRGRILPYYNDWIYMFSNLSRQEKKHTNEYKKFISEVIEKKLAEYKSKDADKNNQIYSEETHYPTFLELLIQLTESETNWTKEDLFDEVSTFMIAGSETTSTVVSFTMVLLGMHQEIQGKCFEEINDVIGLDRKIINSDLAKFVYLEQVIKETLRMFPAGPTLFRQVDEDLEVGGYVLPKGSGLMLYPLTMHYSEVYFKNPWTFNPDRFTPDEIAKRHKYAYLPFSAGPRNCIGSKFGMMAMKTVLANAIKNYRIETTYKDIRDIRFTQVITIKAIDGYPIRLIARH